MFRKVTDQMEFSDLRATDRIVLKALRRVRSATRSDLVKLCHLPRTTIYDAIIRLERLGTVERYPEERTKRGRRKILYRIPYVLASTNACHDCWSDRSYLDC
ncbi:MAG: helix-turn-helix transcriptional regulator [Candidatus Heimdallarchaeota archaeon]